MATANPTYSAIMRNRYPEEVQQAFELIAKGDCAGAVKNIASIATKLGTLPDEVMFHLRDKEHRTIIHHASFHGQTGQSPNMIPNADPLLIISSHRCDPDHHGGAP